MFSFCLVFSCCLVLSCGLSLSCCLVILCGLLLSFGLLLSCVLLLSCCLFLSCCLVLLCGLLLSCCLVLSKGLQAGSSDPGTQCWMGSKLTPGFSLSLKQCGSFDPGRHFASGSSVTGTGQHLGSPEPSIQTFSESGSGNLGSLFRHCGFLDPVVQSCLGSLCFWLLVPQL